MGAAITLTMGAAIIYGCFFFAGGRAAPQTPLHVFSVGRTLGIDFERPRWLYTSGLIIDMFIFLYWAACRPPDPPAFFSVRSAGGIKYIFMCVHL